MTFNANRLGAPLIGLAAVALAVATTAGAATLTNLTVHSAAMNKGVPVTVVLPDAAAAKAARFPCVYVLHGAGGNHRKVENAVITNLVDRYGFIAVGPDGGKTSWWLDAPADPTCRYETFVTQELIPVIDATFQTLPERGQRAIMGGSMGGHGACYLGMRHTDLFGAIGNIYGGVDLVPWHDRWDLAKRLGPRDKFPERWAEHSVVNVAKSLKNGEVELISTVGTEDFFLGCNRQLHDLLSANGVAHTYVEARAPSTIKSTHSHFYNQGAEICLKFIANFFRDGFGHLGDINLKALETRR